jgi:hypothetical protein
VYRGVYRASSDLSIPYSKAFVKQHRTGGHFPDCRYRQTPEMSNSAASWTQSSAERSSQAGRLREAFFSDTIESASGLQGKQS